MELLFLGTSCAVPTASNGNSSFVLKSGKMLLLFEAGGDPYRGLLAAGVPPTDIDVLVISHFHADHASGFPGLLSIFSCIKRTQALTVVAPRETIKKLVQICKLLKLYGEDLSFPVFYSETFSAQGITIKLFPAHHTVPASMVRCSDEKVSLFYTGDTAFHPDIAEYSRGCKLLIHDSTTSRDAVACLPGHSCPYEAGLSARAAKVDTLFLTHLCYDNFSSPESPAYEARLSFDGEVILPTLWKWYNVHGD
jgi:ribonuclease Z